MVNREETLTGIREILRLERMVLLLLCELIVYLQLLRSGACQSRGFEERRKEWDLSVRDFFGFPIADQTRPD
jgi:hypothetical protein